MNIKRNSGTILKFFYSYALQARGLLGKQKCSSFGRINDETASHKIEQIFVINLDRQPVRWRQVTQELSHVLDASGIPLSHRTNRIQAVDARLLDKSMKIDEVKNTYTLGDQLFVDPRQLLPRNLDLDEEIEMTQQEIAIALSHIKAWRHIANGNYTYVLVLEDDVCFRYNFARFVERIWHQLCTCRGDSQLFDILYLSFKEVDHGAEKFRISENVFKLFRGLWYLSGYVLSKKGAKKLLNLLPVRGPVDLWINHKFKDLDALTASKSVINQRVDQKSENSYSVLPVLSKIGVLNSESPVLFQAPSLVKPVFAIGSNNSGLTSLAMALSMLGYRCCSDLNGLPGNEESKLMTKDESRVFDAYVNIGMIDEYLEELATLYPQARLIIAIDEDSDKNKLALSQRQKWYKRTLILPSRAPKKWNLLCEFLDTVPPVSQYPSLPEKGQREVCKNSNVLYKKISSSERWLKADTSPWIAPVWDKWKGFSSNIGKHDALPFSRNASIIIDNFNHLDEFCWFLREDTFPGNLALFRPSNVSINASGPAEIKIQQEDLKVRNYSSGALTTHAEFLFGRFEAVLKPPKVSGLVTGLFLHRDSPRQEIDIEFIGKYPRKVLLNVFYNPGGEGARFDYGYRGTPVLIDLGFDTTTDLHSYAIEWTPDDLIWYVDGQLVHKRVNWAPTPIPHLPMRFHVNLWPSNSRKLAGKISNKLLPTNLILQSVKLSPLG